MRDKRRYFYAREQVRLFDDIAPLVEPRYETIHTLLALLAGEHLMGHTGRTLRILDLGPGTGRELRNLESSACAPEVTCVEVAKEMAEVLEEAWTTPAGGKSRLSLKIVVGDFFESEDRARIRNSFDLVISAFALHHGTPAEKAALYRWIAGRLKPGGLFLNADLLRLEEDRLQAIAEQYLESWITQSLSPSSGSLPRSLRQLSSEEIGALRQKWLTHIKHENQELPFHRSAEHRTCEFDLLREASFRKVELPVRILGAGIIWALR